MAFVYKLCEIKKNDTGSTTLAKNEVFIGLYYEHCYLVVGTKIWREIFPGRWRMSKFLARWGEGQEGKPCRDNPASPQ